MKGSSADYHQEMNTVNFEKWFEDKLLPALPASSLIVMDNASYHRYVLYSPQFIIVVCCSHHLEEQQKQKWRKAQLKEWLDNKGEYFHIC